MAKKGKNDDGNLTGPCKCLGVQVPRIGELGELELGELGECVLKENGCK